MQESALQALLAAVTARREGSSEPLAVREQDLSGIVSNGADLGLVDLAECNFEGAALRGARLSQSRFRGANLAWTCFDGAKLTRVDFQDADLSGASFDRADLRGADLRGACLAGVMGVPLSIAAAKIDVGAIERSNINASGVAALLRGGVEIVDGNFLRDEVLEVVSADPELAQLLEGKKAGDEPRRFPRVNLRILGDPPEEPPPRAPGSEAKIPIVAAKTLVRMPQPEIGTSALGVSLEEEITGGETFRAFVGQNEDGERVVYKVFDPACHGAPLQLPAFQHSLLVLNALQSLGEQEGDSPRTHVAGVLAVATDLTAVVMPYYENGTIENLVDVDISLDTSLELFESVCEIFSQLNARGVQVCAVKPSAILIDGLDPILGEIDAVDLPTLMAKLPDAGGYGPYAAPEVLRGEGRGRATAAVFALGRLMEYLITGQTPLTLPGETPTFAKGVPRSVADLTARCTAVDPAERLQHVEEVLEAIVTLRRRGATRLQSMRSDNGGALQARKPKRVPKAPEKDAKKSLAPKAEKKKRAARNWPWKSPLFDRYVALSATVLAVGTLFLVTLAPDVSSIQTLGWILSGLLGLCTFWIPRPAQGAFKMRFASLLLVVVSSSYVDPTLVAAVRWRSNLDRGTATQKTQAVEMLIETGRRSFAGAKLSQLDLSRHDLSLSDFSAADLSGSDLSNAIFLDSTFTGADLAGAKLQGSDFRATNLAEAKNLDKARCSERTRLPRELSCHAGSIVRR